MKLIDVEHKLKNHSDTLNLYGIGDTHIGARTCCEGKIKSLVRRIANDKNALWIGIGDMIDCIKPSDVKRFEHDCLPDWLLSGSADDIRANLSDIVGRQADRAIQLLNPIKDKCIGIIEGNHEHSIKHYHNEDIHGYICKILGVENLTDEAVIRIKIRHNNHVEPICVYAQHGHGGGRSPGSEVSKLDFLLRNWDVDVVFKGHSHTPAFYPIARIHAPTKGKLKLIERNSIGINPGCFKLAHQEGPSTYESRANYPIRPMHTYYAAITPFANDKCTIMAHQLPL